MWLGIELLEQKREDSGSNNFDNGAKTADQCSA